MLEIAGQSYVVTADSAEAASNAIANVAVYPALPALADNTDVTLVGNHTGRPGVLPDGLRLRTPAPGTIPLNGQGVESYVTSYNGISLRVTKGYDQKYKRSMYSMDVLYGYKTLYPELAVRAMG